MRWARVKNWPGPKPFYPRRRWNAYDVRGVVYEAPHPNNRASQQEHNLWAERLAANLSARRQHEAGSRRRALAVIQERRVVRQALEPRVLWASA